MSAEKMAGLIQNSVAIGMAGLNVSLHNTRVLANRGIISPNEVENIFSFLMETVETLGTADIHPIVMENIGGMMAEIREIAKERWVGKGKPDPEKLGG